MTQDFKATRYTAHAYWYRRDDPPSVLARRYGRYMDSIRTLDPILRDWIVGLADDRPYKEARHDLTSMIRREKATFRQTLPETVIKKVQQMTSAVFTTMTMLERENIHFTIERTRPDTIRINATLVGERLEIDIFDDDHIEISRFYGNEDIEGDIKLLEKIIGDYANHES